PPCPWRSAARCSGACSAPTTPWRRTRSTRARSTGWASRPTHARACRRSSRSGRRASRSGRARTCPSSTPGGKSGSSGERLPHRAVRDAGLEELGPFDAVAEALVERDHRHLGVEHDLAVAPGARRVLERAHERPADAGAPGGTPHRDALGLYAPGLRLPEARRADRVPGVEGEKVQADGVVRVHLLVDPHTLFLHEHLPPDGEAERRVAVDGVDLVEPAVPDVDAALARHDGERLVTARVERADPRARARLRVRDAAHGEGPPDVGIVQPGVALGGVGLLERAEVD